MNTSDIRGEAYGARSSRGAGSALKILMTPDYRRDNPYQALLAQALEELGARVSFPRGYRRVLPLRRMLDQDGLRPNVLHLHWLAPYLKGRNAVAMAAYAAKLIVDLVLVRRAGVRLVWTVHNLVEHEQAHPGIELWCRRRLARLADVIIVHSDGARETVAGAYDVPPEKIFIMPHGHYRDVYGPPIPAAEARRKLRLAPQGRVFLFFGTIRPYKGVLKLLSAWAESPELNERHLLVIAGEALDRRYREAVRDAAEAVPNACLWLGRVPDDWVAALISAADALIVPLENVLTSGSAVLAESYRKDMVAPKLSPDAPFSRDKESWTRAGQESMRLAEQMILFAEGFTGNGLSDDNSRDPPDWHDVSERLACAVRRVVDTTLE